MEEWSVICVAVELDGMFAEDVTEGEEVNDEEQRLQGHVLAPVVTGTGCMFKNCTAVNLQSYIMFGARQNLSELKSIT